MSRWPNGPLANGCGGTRDGSPQSRFACSELQEMKRISRRVLPGVCYRSHLPGRYSLACGTSASFHTRNGTAFGTFRPVDTPLRGYVLVDAATLSQGGSRLPCCPPASTGDFYLAGTDP